MIKSWLIFFFSKCLHHCEKSPKGSQHSWRHACEQTKEASDSESSSDWKLILSIFEGEMQQYSWFSLSFSLSCNCRVCVCCCSGVCAVTAGHVRRGWMGKRSSSPGPTPASGRRRPGTWREEVPLRACLVSSRLCIYFCPSHIDVPPTCALSLCFFFFLLPFSLTSKLTHTFPPRVKHL